MKPKYFTRFFKPQPRTVPFSKKMACYKIFVEGNTVSVDGITRHGQSPVAGEDDPEWELRFHARERKGIPFISAIYRMSPLHFATVLLLLTQAVCTKLGADPVEFLTRLSKAAELCRERGAFTPLDEEEGPAPADAKEAPQK